MLTYIIGAFILLVILLGVFAPKQLRMIMIFCYYQPIGYYWYLFPPPRKSVKDDIILITGGAMGMGAIMGERLGKLGAKIVLWDINEKVLSETVQKLKEGGVQTWGYTCDVSDRKTIYEVAERVKSEVGQVSMLINNAGIMCGKRLLETSDTTIEKTMQINTMSNFWTIKSFLPGMLDMDRGHIVTISSSAGLFGVNRLAPYCASKFATTGLHESLILELFDMKKLAKITDTKGIHLTCVHPYFVNTTLAKGASFGSVIKTYSPEEAVDVIIDGVLRNTRMLLMPPMLGVLLFQKSIFVGDTGLRMVENFKALNAFDNFEGRGWK